MIRVVDVGHLSLRTPDVSRQLDYYTNVLGLTEVAREKGAYYLACPDDYLSIVLREGAESGCDGLALHTAPDADLSEFERQLSVHGAKVSSQSDTTPAVSRSLAFDDPCGTRIEIIPAPAPQKRIRGAGPIVPNKLGHVAFRSFDPAAVADFYVNALGFRVSDWMGDFFVFLRCNPDHHGVNFLRSSFLRLHHFAFELNDWNHVRDTCDELGRHRIPLIWGPGRHALGHNLYTYHNDPEGRIVELYCDLDRMSSEDQGYWDPRPWHEENPLRPKVWQPGPFVSNAWGIATPAGFRDP